jgi:predicted Rossmann fold flavoprotein
MKRPAYSLIVVGGGAAGFFGALAFAEKAPGADILILEKGRELLSKVKISGGGRCNVTHACFDPAELVTYYPRGRRELLGPFHKFGPSDTIHWFESRGVSIKTERDGRMFPVTNNSQTIIDCFLREADQAGIEIRCKAGVSNIEPRQEGGWLIRLTDGTECTASQVLVASGSSRSGWSMLEDLGLRVIDPVPSLFTFQIQDERLEGLQGLSVPAASVEIPEARLSESGPLLITHWGVSGPAVLKLSARGARKLHECAYSFQLKINFLGSLSFNDASIELQRFRRDHGAKAVGRNGVWPEIPGRLWNRLLQAAGIRDEERWADLSGKKMQAILAQVTDATYSVSGKSTFKEEFVTAGGVDLREIDLRSFESKSHPGLFLAGEVLNIDALTGGFNFQAAWTGGYLAGCAAAKRMNPG